MKRLLTDDLRGWVGREARYTAPEEIGLASIRYFALALGDDNPLYRDEVFAYQTPHGGSIAPPTLVCETNQLYDRRPDSDGYIGHTWDLPLPECRLIRGGNEYEFFQPVRPTDRITAAWRISDIYERETSRGGFLLFVVSEVTYNNQDGDLLAINRETVIYQHKGHKAAKIPGGRGASSRDDQSHVSTANARSQEGRMSAEDVRIGQSLPTLERAITLSMMVAYAGATWDWHRYHYDRAFVETMGHPAPFVDGQMLGGLLAKLVLDWAGPDAMLRKLRLRYRAMVYAGEHVICQGRVTGLEEREGHPLVICDLHIEAEDGRRVVDSASAEVELPWAAGHQ